MMLMAAMSFVLLVIFGLYVAGTLMEIRDALRAIAEAFIEAIESNRSKP